MTTSRLISIFLVPICIVVSILALGGLVNDLTHGAVAWNPPLAEWVERYRDLQEATFGAGWSMLQDRVDVGEPQIWLADAIVLYVSMAIAFMFGGAAVTRRESFVDQAGGTIAASGFPLALFWFLIDMFRKRTVTGFAGQHTALFLVYVAVVLAGYYGMIQYNETLAA